MKLDIVSGHGGRAESVANVQQRTVTVYHVTAHDSLPDGQGFQYVTTIDFSEASEAEILRAAADSLIIKMRGRLGFKSNPTPETLNNLTVKASDLMQSSRKNANPAKRKARVTKELQALGMNQEKIDEVLAALK